jgi:hypothetical protein
MTSRGSGNCSRICLPLSAVHQIGDPRMIDSVQVLVGFRLCRCHCSSFASIAVWFLDVELVAADACTAS